MIRSAAAGLLMVLSLCTLRVAGAAVPAGKNFGTIHAAAVIGDVDAVAEDDGTVTPLHNGDLIYEGYTVVTRERASVVLVFSNGATARLTPDTRLSVRRFLQEPLATDELAFAKIAAEEPTVSHTVLRLSHGEIIGQVKKLKKGSTHSVTTPIGAAGIRGTTFRHFYRPNDNGSARYALSTGSGEIEFTDLTGWRTAVAAGKEFGGQWRPGQAGARLRLDSISPRARRLLEHHLPRMRAAAARVIFRRADGRVQPNIVPRIRRDPAGQREPVDDIAEFERAERAREAAQERAKKKDPTPAPAATSTKADKAATKPKSTLPLPILKP